MTKSNVNLFVGAIAVVGVIAFIQYLIELVGAVKAINEPTPQSVSLRSLEASLSNKAIAVSIDRLFYINRDSYCFIFRGKVKTLKEPLALDKVTGALGN